MNEMNYREEVNSGQHTLNSNANTSKSEKKSNGHLVYTQNTYYDISASEQISFEKQEFSKVRKKNPHYSKLKEFDSQIYSDLFIDAYCKVFERAMRLSDLHQAPVGFFNELSLQYSNALHDLSELTFANAKQSAINISSIKSDYSNFDFFCQAFDFFASQLQLECVCTPEGSLSTIGNLEGNRDLSKLIATSFAKLFNLPTQNISSRVFLDIKSSDENLISDLSMLNLQLQKNYYSDSKVLDNLKKILDRFNSNPKQARLDLLGFLGSVQDLCNNDSTFSNSLGAFRTININLPQYTLALNYEVSSSNSSSSVFSKYRIADFAQNVSILSNLPFGNFSDAIQSFVISRIFNLNSHTHKQYSQMNVKLVKKSENSLGLSINFHSLETSSFSKSFEFGSFSTYF